MATAIENDMKVSTHVLLIEAPLETEKDNSKQETERAAILPVVVKKSRVEEVSEEIIRSSPHIGGLCEKIRKDISAKLASSPPRMYFKIS